MSLSCFNTVLLAWEDGVEGEGVGTEEEDNDDDDVEEVVLDDNDDEEGLVIVGVVVVVVVDVLEFDANTSLDLLMSGPIQTNSSWSNKST